MSWVAVAVGVGGAVVGAVGSNRAAGKAADATRDANQAAIDEQRRQFDITRNDQLPWLQAGQNALTQLAALNNGDYSGFMNSPDYLAARDQGMQGINRHLAASGGYYSGGGDADRMKFLSGLATQNLGNYRGSLQSMAGLGQSTASGLGSLGMGMASGIGSLLNNSGQARASSYMQQGNNWAQLAGGIGNAIGYGLSSRPPQQPQAQPYSGAGWTYTGPTAATYGYTG